MKISIITVCKNAEKTIEYTLQSLLSQTYKNFELIIIDGGSTDKTLSILDKYSNNISCLVSEQDSGVYNAMNKGIKAATGDILYFLNANDILYDNSIFKNVVNSFQSDDISLLWGNVQFIDQNRNDLHFENYKMYNKLDFIKQNICHQVIFYKADCFKLYGNYNEDYILYADYDINLRFIVKSKLKAKYIDKPIAKFEIGGLSQIQTEKNIALQLKEKDEILNEHFNDSEKIWLKINRFFYKYFRTPYKLLLKYPKFCNLINLVPNLKLNIIK